MLSTAYSGIPPEEISMVRALRLALSPLNVAFLITLVAATGCTLDTDVSGPVALLKVSGDQSGPTNTTLATPLAVLVTNQFGERIRNVTVTWTIASGGGTLSAPSTLSDDSGVASVTYTTGATTGLVVIRAQVSGIPPLSFNITVI
jgi:hypothetical protein